MSFVIDVIILLILAVVVLISAKKGFVRTVVGVAGLILAFIVAINLGGVLADLTYNKVIEPAIVSAVTEKVADDTSVAVDSVWEALPQFITKNSEAFGIEKDNIAEKLNGTAVSAEAAITELSQTTLKPIATTFLSSVYSIVLFIVLAILAALLSKFINKLFSFSVVGKLNRTLGGIIGIPKGIICGYIFCLLLTVFFFFRPDGVWEFTQENADNSYLYSALMRFSPF